MIFEDREVLGLQSRLKVYELYIENTSMMK